MTSDELDVELVPVFEDVLEASPPVILLVEVSMDEPSDPTFAVTTWGVAVLEERIESTLADNAICYLFLLCKEFNGIGAELASGFNARHDVLVMTFGVFRIIRAFPVIISRIVPAL